MKNDQNLKPILEALVAGQKQIADAIKESNVILENTLEAQSRPQKVEIKGAEVVTIQGKPGENADEGKVVETVSKQLPKQDEIVAEVVEKVRPLIVAQVPTKKELIEDIMPTLETMVPEDGEDGKDGDDGEDADPKEVAELLKSDPEFVEATKGTPGTPGKPGKAGSPDTGEQIIKKIRSVKENGLKSDDISDFDERMRRSKNMLGYLRELGDVEIVGEPNGALVLTWNTTKHKWVATSAAGGVQPLAYDISDQFDGNVSTFTLPPYSAILMFNITGWPPNGALRPTVDFTTPSSTTVSLAGGLSAPELGATGIILYIPA